MAPRDSNPTPRSKTVRRKKKRLHETIHSSVPTGSAESEEKYRSFIENLPVLFYAVKPDPPYSPIYVSPAFAQFGYPLNQWLDDPEMWLKVIHPDDREWVFKQTKASTRSGKNAEYEYRAVLRDGSIRWVRDRGCLIRDKSGRVIHRQGVIADITEQKLSDQELQKREKQYRTLAKNIPSTAVVLFDHEFRYTLADGEQLKKHDYSQEMFEDKTLWEVFPKDIAEEWAPLYRRALDGEHISLERTNDDGCFQIHVLPVKDEHDRIFAGMVMWQDITERKNVEEDLKESESRYRNLFENASDIIYVHDLEGNYISINHAAERIIGYSREEAQSMNMSQIAAPEHLKLVKKKLAKKVAGSARQTAYEIDCLTKDERRITLEINSSAILKDGVPVAIQGIARDITERKRSDEALRESEAKFRTLAETASDAIITIDDRGTISFVNAGTEKIFGYSADEMVGQNLAMLMPERLREAHKAGIKRYSASGKRNIEWKAVELPGLHRDGHEVQLELSFAEYNKGGRKYFTSVIRDITERKQAQEALKESEARFRELFENANDLIYTHDLKGNFTSLNRAGERITGYSREEALKMSISEVVAPEYLEYAQQMTLRKLDGEAPTSYELEITAKDGRRVMLELSTRLIHKNDKPVGVQGIGRDITSRRHAEDLLMYNARHDALTGLPNRMEFMQHLDAAVQQAKNDPEFKFAVLFLDLDRFKVINDSLGHLIGDKLLIGIAKRLSTTVRPRDIVARLGGDEFTVLLNRINDPADAEIIGERLQRKLSEPFKFGNYEVFSSASIGIIVADDIKRDAEDFLRDADTAMYRAKETGKARCEVFDREMHVRNMNLLQVESDLRRALERREFEVFYQPIISLENGRISEFEALIRWNHPAHGSVAPNEFISVAEETGIIIPIGRWVIEESCRQLKDWHVRYPTHSDLTVSVNLSAKQLMHPVLRVQVEEILQKTNLNPKFLSLEVTESTVIERSEIALAVLSELKSLGVTLSTDDFGTGYSSLSYLHQFPFERLKIDRTFIDKMEHDAKSQAIVRSILLLGQNLKMEVVAEGIETLQQLESLRALGCRLGQGFFFSRPVNAGAAEQLIQRDKELFAMESLPGFNVAEPIIETSNVQ